jgi:DNA-binding response OmpR family regulator
MSEVLVIDDEPSVSSALKLILEDSGYRVAVALNGRDGIEQARRKRFCLTITDMCLPDMTGLDVINSLREGWPPDNFILITSHKSDEISFAARECGVTLLHKPFPPAEILQLMETSLAGCGRTFCAS